MSNAGYGNYVEDTPGQGSSEKAPAKPGDASPPATPASGEAVRPGAVKPGVPDGDPTVPGQGALADDPQGDEVDPGVG